MGLHLLFSSGERPGIEDLRRALKGHPDLAINGELPRAPGGSEPEAEIGVELAIHGLTFDLCGLAGGAPVSAPAWRNLVACDHDEASATFEAVELRLGPHVASGPTTLPVSRGWVGCGAILGELLPRCLCYIWPPASLAIGARFFHASVRRWVDKGAFPTHALIAFNRSLDGAIQSAGLAFFTGQELRLEPPLPYPAEEGERLAAILAGHLVLNGPLGEVQAVTEPNNGPIRLEPSANGRFVRAWHG